MSKELICITCPVGCHLQVDFDEFGEILVTGNRCKRGIDYAREEMTCPKRMVTATCAVASKEMNRIPVRTDRPVPKEAIDGLLTEIYGVSLTPPVKRGEIILDLPDVKVVVTMTVEA